MKNVMLKTKKGLILPEYIYMGKPVPGFEDIPLAKALKAGLAVPARRVGKGRIEATPAGMGVFAKWAVKVVDKAGKAVPFRHPVTKKMVMQIEGPSHSFTRNLGFFVRGFLNNVDSALNLNETLTEDGGGTFLARLKGGVTGNAACVSGLAKIKFGNSSAALSTTQFNLQGTILGPVTEGTVAVVLVVEDTVQTIFTCTGQVTNGTGGAFTVEEMGLFPELTSAANVLNNTTMMLRDLTGPVVVNNGQTIIGQYTFTLTV
jgi:hypothetical protein